jgi:5-hydroxyisourate hydrolase
MMSSGYLTTHILDTARGCPAAGINLELFRIEAGKRKFLTKAVTNSDGRTDAPVVAEGNMTAGVYELQFEMAEYFAPLVYDAAIAFSGTIILRFGIDKPDEHYHVPLLVSPFSYSTYRGS